MGYFRFIAPIGLSLMQNGSHCNGLDIPEISTSIMKKDTYPLMQKDFLSFGLGQFEHKSRSGLPDCHIHGYMTEAAKTDPSCAKLEMNGSCDKTSQSSKSSSLSPFSLSTNGRCPELNRAMESVKYMAECTKQEEESDKVREDWKFVAMVLDRLFLWIFSVAVVVGTAGIILQAPSLYDLRPAIDEMLSEIEAAVAKPMGHAASLM